MNPWTIAGIVAGSVIAGTTIIKMFSSDEEKPNTVAKEVPGATTAPIQTKAEFMAEVVAAVKAAEAAEAAAVKAADENKKSLVTEITEAVKAAIVSKPK